MAQSGHMKTTIEISDPLLRRAKHIAHDQHQTLRSLVEEGLTRVIEEREQQHETKIQPVVFGGNGLTPEFENASWEVIRRAAYEGHGS